MIKLPVSGSTEEYTVNPSKIIALGLNYNDHIKESVSILQGGFKPEQPSEPVIFPKAPSSVTGTDMPIIIPSFLKSSDFSNELRTDYEAELAFFIKKDCKNISAADAMDYIAGFTCLNDVSQRNIQTGDRSGWFRGKSFDTFCPVGPVFVKTEDLGDPNNLEIECRMNGETVQRSNTSMMIFTVAEIVEILSSWFTLKEGDLISTGTPSGVGAVKSGDLVEVEIEKIGILKNTVIEEGEAN